jgi:hypothetical protein
MSGNCRLIQTVGTVGAVGAVGAVGPVHGAIVAAPGPRAASSGPVTAGRAQPVAALLDDR